MINHLIILQVSDKKIRVVKSFFFFLLMTTDYMIFLKNMELTFFYRLIHGDFGNIWTVQEYGKLLFT